MALTCKAFGDIITFTRASSATFVGSNGLIQSATTNTPRFDYDPVTLAAKGLLIEEQRTNLLLNSETLVSWAKTRASTAISSPAVLAPDNATTAYKLTEDSTASATHQISTAISTTSANPRAYSFFAKEAGRYIFTVERTNTPIVFFTHTFDLSTGTATGGGKIEAFPNGWYRCSGVYTTTSLTDQGIIIRLADASGNTTYTGNGTSGLYIWGTQIEDGSFPTSYIPTVASQVTRSADVASVNTLSPWYNASEGTLYVENSYSSGSNLAPNNRIAAMLANVSTPNSDRHLIYNKNGAANGALVQVGGVSQASLSGATATANIVKSAYAFKQNDFALSVNGAAPATDTSGALPSVGVLFIAHTNTLGQLGGHVRRLTYYPRRLSNAELQAITA